MILFFIYGDLLIRACHFETHRQTPDELDRKPLNPFFNHERRCPSDPHHRAHRAHGSPCRRRQEDGRSPCGRGELSGGGGKRKKDDFVVVSPPALPGEEFPLCCLLSPKVYFTETTSSCFTVTSCGGASRRARPDRSRLRCSREIDETSLA